ncbi:hypothetical protein DKX38_020025 [Salix brachista]|uniref:Uncharacterized protein n=1 Tax=Salix brachista TaxID=2182728 RepID=A0A5N5KHZ2_9ROSI|nr:hypothetical protein DKX38_020025 [Salix brachista]
MIRGIRSSKPILVHCHAAALGSRLPSIASAKAGVAGAIALLQPFSSRDSGSDEASTRCCPSCRQNMLISKSDVVFAGHQ